MVIGSQVADFSLIKKSGVKSQIVSVVNNACIDQSSDLHLFQ